MVDACRGWSDSAHLWLGKGMERAPVFGHEYGHSRGGVSLVRQAISERNLFLDQKSRGFHLHTSYLANPQRLSRLLIASCLASIWIVYLGSVGIKEGWVRIIHRRHRCDLSLFQLGLRLLEHLLNEEMTIPVQFHVTI